MARTITQIMGEAGIAQNATNDIFANTENATLDTVKRTLAELQSNQSEINAAKGMGRSTFSDAINAKQQNDVLSPVFAQFAQARQQEDLNQTAFNRQVVGQNVAADINTAAATAAYDNQFKVANQQAENQAKLLTQQTGAQKELNTQAAGIQSNYLTQQTGAQKELNTQTAGFQTAFFGTQLAGQSQLAEEQARLNQAGTANTVNLQTAAQKELNTQQAAINANTLQSQFTFQTQQAQTNFQNQMAALDKEYALKMEGLDPELKLKAQYQKEILQDQYAVQNQQALNNIMLSTVVSMVSKLATAAGQAQGGIVGAVQDAVGGLNIGGSLPGANNTAKAAI